MRVQGVACALLALAAVAVVSAAKLTPKVDPPVIPGALPLSKGWIKGRSTFFGKPKVGSVLAGRGVGAAHLPDAHRAIPASESRASHSLGLRYCSVACCPFRQVSDAPTGCLREYGPHAG